MTYDKKTWVDGDVITAEDMNNIENGIANVNYFDVVTPEMFGAKGDGATDDTNAIQSAVENKGLIVFDGAKNYLVTNTIRLKKDTVLDLNGATITSTNKHLFFNFQGNDAFVAYNGNGNICIKNGTIIGGAISFAHAENVLLDNMDFKNSLNDHFLEICACKNYVISGCSFIGMENLTTSVLEYINIDPCVYSSFPWTQEGSAFYDGTKNSGIKIDNCYFSIGEGDYAYGDFAIGCHTNGGISNTKHEGVVITNNRFENIKNWSINISDMKHVLVSENTIYAGKYGIHVGVIRCEDVVVKSNYISTPDKACVAVGVEGCDGLSIVSNDFFRSGRDGNQFMCIGLDNGLDKVNGVSYNVLQRLNVCWNTDNTSVTLDIPPTKLDSLWVTVGAIGDETFSVYYIKSFKGRCFVEGEKYPIVVVLSNGTLERGFITITATGVSLTSSDNRTIRFVEGQKIFN